MIMEIKNKLKRGRVLLLSISIVKIPEPLKLNLIGYKL
jgi:hypothetical protein